MAPSNQKDPLFPKHLVKLSKVDSESDIQRLVWAAMCFLFRTLLRVSHVVSSPHTLLNSDVVFTNWGFFVEVCSSKTKKKSQKPQYIPLVRSPGSPICPVALLEEFWASSGSGENCLFSTSAIPAITYSMFHKTMDLFIQKADLPGSFSSHSLRRRGASFMSTINCTIPQIQSRGNWASDCVYEYVIPSLEHDLRVDSKFSSCYSQFR